MIRCTVLVALGDICLAQKGLLFKGCNYFSISLYLGGYQKPERGQRTILSTRIMGTSKGNPNTLLKCEDQVVISNCIIFDCGERWTLFEGKDIQGNEIITMHFPNFACVVFT